MSRVKKCQIKKDKANFKVSQELELKEIHSLVSLPANLSDSNVFNVQIFAIEKSQHIVRYPVN